MDIGDEKRWLYGPVGENGLRPVGLVVQTEPTIRLRVHEGSEWQIDHPDELVDPWPVVAPEKPGPKDVVQVLMTEDMARRFEARVLGPAGVHTVGSTALSPPLLFREDDLPTYLVSTGP